MPARKKLLVSLFVLAIFLFLQAKIFAQVVINEVSPASAPEWVEILNTTTNSISLSGYSIDFGDTNQVKNFCNNDQISANSYKLIILSSNWLANDGDTVNLKNGSSVIDSISYGTGTPLFKPSNIQSITRSPDGSSTWTRTDSPSQQGDQVSFDCPTSTPTPTPSPTPEPTSTPTSTPTPTPSPTKATYKINDVKDENGNVLKSVQIYVDNIYIHHLDAETITFCENCKCDPDGQVACGFGSHVITLQKTGYSNWAEAKTFNSGNNYEVNPVMQVSSSTASSTSTPTPTPTPHSSTLPTPSASASASAKAIATGLSLVLGESASSTAAAAASGKPNDQPVKPSKNSNLLTPVLLILGALGVLGTGLSLFWLKRKKNIME